MAFFRLSKLYVYPSDANTGATSSSSVIGSTSSLSQVCITIQLQGPCIIRCEARNQPTPLYAILFSKPGLSFFFKKLSRYNNTSKRVMLHAAGIL
jgi:hypothetical protein